MLFYCLKCRKNSKSENTKVVKINYGKIMFLLSCALCDSKKRKFIKEQGPSGLLISLGTKNPISKIF